VYSFSEFNSCAEILLARIGMAFGICGRNKNCRASLRDAKNSYQESRKPGIIVEALVPNAWRLAETPQPYFRD
jgi:hypothetical protein